MNVISKTSWFRVIEPRPSAQIRLFCFPYAGSGASVFRAWPENLHPNIELWAVQLPGRENRIKENLFLSLDLLAEALIEVIVPYLDKPYALFGHSMGGVVGFEVAHRLQDCGHPPICLFVSGHSAPQCLIPRKKPFHLLAEQEFIQVLKQLNGIPRDVLDSREMLDYIIPILRADFSICETYTYHPRYSKLACPVFAYGGRQDQEVSCEQIAGWKEHTSGDFAMTIFPGDHFFLNTHKTLVIQTLSKQLEDVLEQ